MPPEPAIALEAVTKRFGPLEVLRDVDLEIAPSATVAVIGPSGSGKSTLVRCLNHLERIQGGTIRISDVAITAAGVFRNGARLSQREIARVRTRIGMVFQAFNLFPHLTVLRNIVEAPIGVLGWPRDEARERAMALLEKVNLAEKADAYPATLSGGQQQRVAIVRALIMDPPIMLFDEPTSALDPELKGEVLRVIRDLAISGRTSVIVTHELNFAHEIASEVIFMDGGRIVERGAPHEVLRNPTAERTRAFIGKIFA